MGIMKYADREYAQTEEGQVPAGLPGGRLRPQQRPPLRVREVQDAARRRRRRRDGLPQVRAPQVGAIAQGTAAQVRAGAGRAGAQEDRGEAAGAEAGDGGIALDRGVSGRVEKASEQANKQASQMGWDGERPEVSTVSLCVCVFLFFRGWIFRII